MEERPESFSSGFGRSISVYISGDLPKMIFRNNKEKAIPGSPHFSESSFNCFHIYGLSNNNSLHDAPLFRIYFYNINALGPTGNGYFRHAGLRFKLLYERAGQVVNRYAGSLG